MSIYTNRALRGGSLGAFSAFAGGGRAIFGPFSFAEQWSSDDFGTATHFNTWVKPWLDQVGRVGMTYTPLSTTIKSRAVSAWAVWQQAADLGDASAQSYMDDVTAKMKDLISTADGLTNTNSLGHRSEDTEVSRYDTFIAIVNLVKQVANSGPKAKAVLAAVQTVDSPDISQPRVNTGAAHVPGDITSGSLNRDAAEAAPPSHMLLYAGIGAGALLLLGGVLLSRRRRASSVAGYRRRRR